MKDSQGNLKTKKQDVLHIWKTHFEKHLNTQFKHDENALQEFDSVDVNNENIPPITEQEVKYSIKQLSNRKSPGVDGITSELIKAGGEIMTKTLTNLFNKIIVTENPPNDWSKMIITPIHKKGDKLNAANYRAIALLPIPGKIFCKILMNRCSHIIESSMSDSQFGFRPGRGTTDAIFIIRQLIEKAKEHQIPIHFHFIDFKAAFDTIWRDALWKMLLKIGIPNKLVEIIKNLYDKTECSIIAGGELSDWFPVNIGVRQGCIMSPSLFNIFLEYIMKGVKSLNRDFQLNENMSVDIRYADDTTLISAVFEKLQLSTLELEQACQKWGLKINPLKCAIITPDSNAEIEIDNNVVPKVSKFKFLGSLVPDCSSDVQHRISMASQAFGRLRTIWSSKDVSIHLKTRLYGALILPIATYGSESWTTRRKEIDALLVFEMKCLRAILRITRSGRLRNTMIRKKLNISETIEDIVLKRRLRWFGHVVRNTSTLHSSYKLDFKKKRPRGRPPKRWSDGIREQCGEPLLNIERRAKRRDAFGNYVFMWKAKGR